MTNYLKGIFYFSIIPVPYENIILLLSAKHWLLVLFYYHDISTYKLMQQNNVKKNSKW